MSMKSCFYIFLICLLTAVRAAAQPRTEITGNLPDYAEAMKSGLDFPMAWHNSRLPFAEWRAEARGCLLACAGAFPPAVPFDSVLLASERRDGYTAHKILFNVSAWSRVPAYLLVPDGDGPFPAILMLHDHGAHFSIGKEKMVRPFDVPAGVSADTDDWVRRNYDSVYVADEFARAGYVVLAVDALMWGDRQAQGGTQYALQQALAANLMQLGCSLGGLMLADDMRSADFLASLPCVDAARVGALGFSMGAWRAWMLAAATDKVSAAAAVCWLCTTDALLVPGNNQLKGGSAYAMLLPGLARYMDYPHAASIACPKPMLFFNGTRDKLFPVNGVQDAYDVLHQVWASQGAEGRLVMRLWDAPHCFNRAMQAETLRFFNAVWP